MLPSRSLRLFSRQKFSWFFLAAICLALGAPRAVAQDWPQFRGPTGDGLSTATDVPMTWGGKSNENVLWTADLLGDGIASPIVCKDRIFVVNASRKADDKKIDREYPEQYVGCYETKQGKLLWNTIVPPGP
jgi:outer membrane protein assembly factor BamB